MDLEAKGAYYIKLGKIKGVHDIALINSATKTAKVIVNGNSKDAISNDLPERLQAFMQMKRTFYIILLRL